MPPSIPVDFGCKPLLWKIKWATCFQHLRSLGTTPQANIHCLNLSRRSTIWTFTSVSVFFVQARSQSCRPSLLNPASHTSHSRPAWNHSHVLPPNEISAAIYDHYAISMFIFGFCIGIHLTVIPHLPSARSSDSDERPNTAMSLEGGIQRHCVLCFCRPQ